MILKEKLTSLEADLKIWHIIRSRVCIVNKQYVVTFKKLV